MLLGAILTGALDKNIDLPGFIAFREPDSRDLHVKTISLPAFYALEMYMFMAVFGSGTRLGAQRIFEASPIVEHFMNQTAVEKSLQRPIYGNSVYVIRDLLFDIAMGESVIFVQEQMQYFLPGGRGPQPEILQKPI